MHRQMEFMQDENKTEFNRTERKGFEVCKNQMQCNRQNLSDMRYSHLLARNFGHSKVAVYSGGKKKKHFARSISFVNISMYYRYFAKSVKSNFYLAQSMNLYSLASSKPAWMPINGAQLIFNKLLPHLLLRIMH